MAIRSAPPRHVAIAFLLAFLAGCVDAVGFAMLGGLFVSFMSGNTTRLGVFLAQGDYGRAAQVLAVIAFFVAGAALGSILVRTTGARQQTIVLGTEAALLVVAATISRFGSEAIGPLVMAMAMGLENATFVNAKGEASINLTFMTGALFKLGEGIGALLTGDRRFAWWPYPLLWLSLMFGAAVGTLSFARWGVEVLYGVAALIVVSATMLRSGRERDETRLTRG